MTMFNVQRTLVTPRVGKPELLFMCSACCRIVLYNCVKFVKIFQTVYIVMKWTRMMGIDMNGGRTDTQNFEGYNIIPSLLFVV